MEQSILRSVKKNLALEADYTAFDVEVSTHINAAFSTLSQMGLGPQGGFVIEDNAQEWSQFLDPVAQKEPLGLVKTYIYLKVRLLFDPPGTPHAISSFQSQLEELEWRLSVFRESVYWVSPLPRDPMSPDTVLDGGDAG